MRTKTPIDNRHILIMATNGFEQSELEVPERTLSEAGAKVDIASQQSGSIKGWDKKDWGSSVGVDLLIKDVDPADYDALVLPGGQMNPDLLRIDQDAIELIRKFDAMEKPIAAICHAPWLLIEAGLVEGKRMTCYKSIRTDLENAGARVVDSEVAVDGHFITSRCPEDLPAFCDAIIECVGKAALAEVD